MDLLRPRADVGRDFGVSGTYLKRIVDGKARTIMEGDDWVTYKAGNLGVRNPFELFSQAELYAMRSYWVLSDNANRGSQLGLAHKVPRSNQRPAVGIAYTVLRFSRMSDAEALLRWINTSAAASPFDPAVPSFELSRYMLDSNGAVERGPATVGRFSVSREE